ncbi:MAG: hypothetical protein MN733_04720 [Nitrososphaera sp.]|nr:hypothetical protein [Nitrososphaera sp.]
MQLHVRESRVVSKNGPFLRLKIAIFGYAKLCDYDDLQFYAFRCPIHGLTTDHERGHERYLCCSLCQYE